MQNECDRLDDAWEVFALATFLRSSLANAGGDELAGISLRGDVQEAVMIGLDRIVTLTRRLANESSRRPVVSDTEGGNGAAFDGSCRIPDLDPLPAAIRATVEETDAATTVT